jgi:hypothetical protein
MARLYRPHIPALVKLRVILRQLGEMFPDDVISTARKNRAVQRQLAGCLEIYAANLGCTVADLRLDHDPPLGVRKQKIKNQRFSYVPDANDPEYLFYRPHGTQFAGSHDVKTRIRGDHGQFSDIVLIKRARRRERGPKPKRANWPKRPMKSGSRWPKKGVRK